MPPSVAWDTAEWVRASARERLVRFAAVCPVGPDRGRSTTCRADEPWQREDLAPRRQTCRPTGHAHTLKAGAIGLVGVLFIAVANAAPITAMTGNTPIAIGYGNGIGAPAGFLVATIVLTLFAIGFVEMARHITTAGAFYGFITHGLGQVWGMASGALATMAYVVFEGSLIGIFAYFTNDALDRWFGCDVNWLILALDRHRRDRHLRLLRHQHRRGLPRRHADRRGPAARRAGVRGALLRRRSRRHGARGDQPAQRLQVAGGAAAASGLRSTARPSRPAARPSACSSRSGRGSASRPPRSTARSRATRKHIVPRATLIAVVGLGTFYTFVSWMMIAGNGKAAVDREGQHRLDRPVGRPGRGQARRRLRRRHLPVPHRHRARSPAGWRSTPPPAATSTRSAASCRLTKNTLGAHPRHARHPAHRLDGRRAGSRWCSRSASTS